MLNFKTIEEYWRDYRATCLPNVTDHDQIQDLRYAFFAGAQGLLALANPQPGDKSVYDGATRIDNFRRDIVAAVFAPNCYECDRLKVDKQEAKIIPFPHS